MHTNADKSSLKSSQELNTVVLAWQVDEGAAMHTNVEKSILKRVQELNTVVLAWQVHEGATCMLQRRRLMQVTGSCRDGSC